jgi:hypothetical protein
MAFISFYARREGVKITHYGLLKKELSLTKTKREWICSTCREFIPKGQYSIGYKWLRVCYKCSIDILNKSEKEIMFWVDRIIKLRELIKRKKPELDKIQILGNL